jgi:hypothetical protein
LLGGFEQSQSHSAGFDSSGRLDPFGNSVVNDLDLPRPIDVVGVQQIFFKKPIPLDFQFFALFQFF